MSGLVDLSLFAVSPGDDRRFTVYGAPPTDGTEPEAVEHGHVTRGNGQAAKPCLMKPLPPLPRTAICRRIPSRGSNDPRPGCILHRMKRSKSEEPGKVYRGTLYHRRRMHRAPQLTLTVPSPSRVRRYEAVRSDVPQASAMVWLEEEAMWRPLRNGTAAEHGRPTAVSNQRQRQQSCPAMTTTSCFTPTRSHPEPQTWQQSQYTPSVYSFHEPRLSAYAATSLNLSTHAPALSLSQRRPDVNSSVPSFYGSIRRVTSDIRTPPLTPITDVDIDSNHSPLTPVQSQLLSLITRFREEEGIYPTLQEAVAGFLPPDLAAVTPISSTGNGYEQQERGKVEEDEVTVTRTGSSSSSSSSYDGRRDVMDRVAQVYHHRGGSRTMSAISEAAEVLLPT